MSIFYNMQGTEGRAGLIMSEKYGDPQVSLPSARVLARFDADRLQEYRHAGTSAFNNVENPTDAFRAARVELEALVKTNPAATESSVRAFNTMSKDDYYRALSDLAGNMNADPGFAKGIVQKLKDKPDSLADELKSFANAKRDGKLEQYIAANGGVAAHAAAPRPSPSAPAEDNGELNAETGIALYEGVMNSTDSRRKALADLIRSRNLDGKIREKIKESPNAALAFNDPATRQSMVAALKDEKDDVFLGKLALIKLGAVPEAAGGSQTLAGTTGDLMQMLNLVRSSRAGSNDFIDRVIGDVQEGAGIFTRAWKSFNAPDAKTSGQGTYEQLAALYRSGDPARIAYANDVKGDVVAGLRSGNKGLVNYNEGIAAGGYGLSKEQIAMIKAGGDWHVNVITDPNTRERRPSSTVTPAPSLEESAMKVKRVPAIDRAINDPDPRALEDLAHEERRKVIEESGKQPSGVETFPIR